MTATQHYNATYFAYQQSIGEFGGWANVSKFRPYIKPTDVVLDFGCGGGYLLKNLVCARRLGIEVNPIAAREAEGIEIHATLDAIPDNTCDVIISNHALEHTSRPLDELRSMHAKLRPGGKAVIVVPSESVNNAYRRDNPDHHLYTWSPMNLGNLMNEADFDRVTSEALRYRWPPRIHHDIARIFGRTGFDLACRVYGELSQTVSQVRAIGVKPTN